MANGASKLVGRVRALAGRGSVPEAPQTPVDVWMAETRRRTDSVARTDLLVELPAALPDPDAGPDGPDYSRPDLTLVLLLSDGENAPETLRELVRDLAGEEVDEFIDDLTVDVVAVLRGMTGEKAAAVARRYAENPQVRLGAAGRDASDGACWELALGLVRAPVAVFAQGLAPTVNGHWLPDLVKPLEDPDVRVAEPSMRVVSVRRREVPPPRPFGLCLAARTEEVRGAGGFDPESPQPVADLIARLRETYGGGPAVSNLTVEARAYAVAPAPGRRPPRRDPVVPAKPRGRAGAGGPLLPEEVPSLAWSIWTPVPYGRQRLRWGDYYFALSLADALRRLGQQVSVDFVESMYRQATDVADVVLALRGLQRYELPPPSAVSMMWVISHPELVDVAHELAGWDAVYAAGPSWARSASRKSGRPVETLLQCTDATRFHPGAEAREQDAGSVLFVGNARGVRPAVASALEAGLGEPGPDGAPPALAVYGQEWEGLLPDGVLRGRLVANEDLPGAYAAARVVLADHQEDMRRIGFVNNRLFDAAATGARVVCDDVPGAADPFGGLVRPYASAQEFAALVAADAEGWPDPEAARAAAEAVVAEHSFDARATRLLADALTRRAVLRS